jgi:hypothetical protein
VPEAESLTRVLQAFNLVGDELAPAAREWARVFDPGAHLLWKLANAGKLRAWLDENRAHLKALKVLHVQAGGERAYSIYIDPKGAKESKETLAASARRIGGARPPLPHERLRLRV